MPRVPVTLASLMAVLLFLRTFPPELFSLYPACPFHALTGLFCPGCGGSRALAALATGHLHEAVLRNPLITVSTPLLAARIVWAYGRQRTCVIPPGVAPYLFATVAVYGILRNVVFL